MVVETIVFFVMLYAFVVGTALRRAWLRRRDRRRAEWVSQRLAEMRGKPLAEAVSRFGSPFEVITGTERSFYVWKSPPSENFPRGSGLLIVNVITDAAGQVTQSSWSTR
jgi:hypothetical protein